VGATRRLTRISAARSDRIDPSRRHPIRWPVPPVVLLLILVASAILPTAAPVGGLGVAIAGDRPVKVLLGRAQSLDPAAQGDIESAAVSAQLFESLTAIDATLQTRPALAASWDFRDGGRTVVFHLRPGLAFSDGSPLTAADVVRSWFRIIDPAHPSPLVSLIGDVVGALDFAHGASSDRSTVGLTVDGSSVVVRLVRPASDFPTIVSSPTFAIVPPGVDATPSTLAPGSRFVGSGGYVLTADTDAAATLTANDHYWARPPPVRTVTLVHDIGGRSPVAAFEAGDVDLVSVSPYDATWLAWDAALGPDLRRSDGLSVQYYGFDTRRPPFDDVRVREAFARAVDWRRLVSLSTSGTGRPATGMVPPGIPGRSDEDFLPPLDPDGARGLLAAAGYPGGKGFPPVTLVGGGPEDRAFAAEIERELGVTVQVEIQAGDVIDRLTTDPPSIFSMGWVADYPGPNDFLGILLGSGSSNNYGLWSSSAFDRAVSEALGATDPVTTRSAFDRAEGIVRDEAPAIPLAYDVEWSLARAGLLGAYSNGLGITRMAGLAWAS
jgi:ABC-type transport system substrate-binding protein